MTFHIKKTWTGICYSARPERQLIFLSCSKSFFNRNHDMVMTYVEGSFAIFPPFWLKKLQERWPSVFCRLSIYVCDFYRKFYERFFKSAYTIFFIYFQMATQSRRWECIMCEESYALCGKLAEHKRRVHENTEKFRTNVTFVKQYSPGNTICCVIFEWFIRPPIPITVMCAVATLQKRSRWVDTKWKCTG